MTHRSLDTTLISRYYDAFNPAISTRCWRL